MNAPLAMEWVEANQRALVAELARLRELLQAHVARQSGAQTPAPGVERADTATPVTSALDFLCARFGLSPFERDVLLLAAGVELEADFAGLCAQAQDDPRGACASFGLALAALPEAHWSALAPDAPLRYWKLVEVGEGRTLVSSVLTIDERILHFLVGVACEDPRLAVLARVMTAADALPASQQVQAQRLIDAWRDAKAALPWVFIDGDDHSGARAVTASACGKLGLQLLAVRGADVPATAEERTQLARLLTRECWLRPAALLLECAEAAANVAAFMDETECLLIVLGTVFTEAERPSLRLTVDRPQSAEQRVLWQTALGAASEEAQAEIAQLAAHYRLSLAQIRDAAAEARAETRRRGADAKDALWGACRRRSRGGLEALAQRIEPRAGWDDLVLPSPQLDTLRDIALQLRHRATVYETWGFAAKSARGLGLSALFAGESGTGKTLAAEVLAGELALDLYRIDLSAVVSKYIGETEKNLKRVFDAAEASGAVLLFDEADALFGRRSSVKDSHDRYANIELAYLLQRMEAYRGLAILTTNMKALLDPAFLRRIRFMVHFPFPDAASRVRIWQRMFPEAMPRNGIDIERLARLNIAGGNVRNIAVNAAFYAADAGVPLAMTHLLRAARAEYAKLEKPLSEAETGGWQ